MGLTYKENVPDTRETPVVDMIRVLKEFGVEVYGYDPLLTREEVASFGVEPVEGLKEGMDAVVVTVGHDNFNKISINILCDIMNGTPIIIDVRGIMNQNEVKNHELLYIIL